MEMYDESKIIELLQRRIIEEWDIKIKSDTSTEIDNVPNTFFI